MPVIEMRPFEVALQRRLIPLLLFLSLLLISLSLLLLLLSLLLLLLLSLLLRFLFLLRLIVARRLADGGRARESQHQGRHTENLDRVSHRRRSSTRVLRRRRDRLASG